MNEAYLAGMEEVLDGLAAAKADLRGVIVTSAKKTFFAGGDLETLIRYGPDDAADGVRPRHPDQGAAAAAGDPRPAGRGRGDRHRARRRPGDRPGLPPPHRPRRAGRGLRAARGDPRAAPRRGRRHPDHPHARHRRRVHEGPGPGAAAQARRRAGDRDRGRAGHVPRGGARPRPGLDRTVSTRRPGNPGTSPATGSPAARRRRRSSPPSCPRSRRTSASSSRAPRCRAAQHPGRGRRGHPGRRRHRAAHRDPVLRRAGHRAGRQEHDQGVLLRHAGDLGRRLAPGRVRAVGADEGRRPRRRDDGRGHRVLVRAGGLGGRAQGRRRRRSPRRARRTPRAWSPRACSAGRRHRRRARPCSPGSPRPTTTPPSPARPGDRGRRRVARGEEGGVRRGGEGRRAGRPAVLEHLHAADHVARRGGRPARRLHRPALLLAGRQDAAHRDHPRDGPPRTPRWPARSTSRSACARPRSSSTTAAASSPAG